MMIPGNRLFCGIDVGKRKHMACLQDGQGKVLLAAFAFTNDAEGFARLQARLAQTAGVQPVLVGLEATGHYWYALAEHVERWGYQIMIINPLQSAQQIRNAIRKHKSDAYDAQHITTLVRTGQVKPAVIPGDLAMSCRQLTRLWYALVEQRAKLKLLLNSRLECLWPEFESYLSVPLGTTGRALLRAAPTPQDLLALPMTALTDLLQRASRGRLGEELAGHMRVSAKTSIGLARGREGMRRAVLSLLDALDALEPVRQRLLADLEDLASRLPDYLLSLPGINAVRAVSLHGEIGDIHTFRTPEALVAFAGLDPKVYQTGQYEAPERQISKRGSPYLRRTLWRMAAIAITTKGPLRQYYQRKRKRGLHHLSAITATALKLTRIVWRICTDQRAYLPKAPKEPQHQV